MTASRLLAVLACLAVGCEKAPQPIAPVAQSGELVVLVIDELSRGEPGRIFGEALTYVEEHGP